jgi:cell division protein ZapA (FtsZ GTPase activity inhibitor)
LAIVNVTINGRGFEVAVADPQVKRVEALGRYMDTRAQKIFAAVGPVSDAQLLLLLGLQLADELAECQAKIAKQKP